MRCGEMLTAIAPGGSGGGLLPAGTAPPPHPATSTTLKIPKITSLLTNAVVQFTANSYFVALRCQRLWISCVAFAGKPHRLIPP